MNNLFCILHVASCERDVSIFFTFLIISHIWEREFIVVFRFQSIASQLSSGSDCVNATKVSKFWKNILDICSLVRYLNILATFFLFDQHFKYHSEDSSILNIFRTYFLNNLTCNMEYMAFRYHVLYKVVLMNHFKCINCNFDL